MSIHFGDSILSYREMCDAEGVQNLQRGMNFRLNPAYSVVLMSQRSNAPYHDQIYPDEVTIEYEGHDVVRRGASDTKSVDQPEKLPSGRLTQNGQFAQSVRDFKEGIREPEPVKIYEKIREGVWSVKGFFDLIDYKVLYDGKRNVFRFILKLKEGELRFERGSSEIQHTRLIPSQVKKDVWRRDHGKCVICGDTKNLHFDHDLPFSLGGTSLSANNIRLLCMKHNLQKSNKIE